MGAGGPQPAYQVTQGDLPIEAVPLDIEDPEALVYGIAGPFPGNNEVDDDYEGEENSGDDESVGDPEEPISQEGGMNGGLEFNCNNNNAKNESILESQPRSRGGWPKDVTCHHQNTRNFQSPFSLSMMNSSSNNINMTYSTDEDGDLGQGNEHDHVTSEPSNHIIAEDGRRPSLEDLKRVKITSVVHRNRNQSMGGNLSGDKDRSKRGGRHGRRTLETTQRKRRKSADNTISGNKREAEKKARPSSHRPESSANARVNRGETEVSTYSLVCGGVAGGKDVPRMSVHEDCIVETVARKDPLIAGQSTAKYDVLKVANRDQSDEDTNAENTLVDEESIYDLDPTTVTGYTSCSDWWNGNDDAAAEQHYDEVVVAADSRNDVASLTGEVDETNGFMNTHGINYREESLRDIPQPMNTSETKSSQDDGTTTGENGECDENLGQGVEMGSTMAGEFLVLTDGESCHSVEDPVDSSSVSCSAKCKRKVKGRVTFKDPVAYTASSENDFGTFFIRRSSQEIESFPQNHPGYFLPQGVSNADLVKAKSESTLENVRGLEFLTYQEFLQNYSQQPQSLQGHALEGTRKRSRSTNSTTPHTALTSQHIPLPCRSEEVISCDLRSRPGEITELVPHSSHSNAQVEFISRSCQLKSLDLKSLESPDAANEHCDDSENTSKLSLLKSLSSATVVSDFAQCDVDQFDMSLPVDNFGSQQTDSPEIVLDDPASSRSGLLNGRLLDVDDTAGIAANITSGKSQEIYPNKLSAESSLFEAKAADTENSLTTLDETCCDRSLQVGSLTLENKLTADLNSKLSGFKARVSSNTISEDAHQDSLQSLFTGIEIGKRTKLVSKSFTANDSHIKYPKDAPSLKQKIMMSVSARSLSKERQTFDSGPDVSGLFQLRTPSYCKESDDVSIKSHVSEGGEHLSASINSSLDSNKTVRKSERSQSSETTKTPGSFLSRIDQGSQQPQLPGYDQFASEATDREVQMPHPETTKRSADMSSLECASLSSHSLVTAKSVSVICQSLKEFQSTAKTKYAGIICQGLDTEFEPSATFKSESVICNSLESNIQASVTVKSESVICQNLESEIKTSATVQSESVICQSLQSDNPPSATAKSQSVICQSLGSDNPPSATVKSQSVICQSLESDSPPSATVKSKSVICQTLCSDIQRSATVQSQSVICQSIDHEFLPSETVISASVICQSLEENEFQSSAAEKIGNRLSMSISVNDSQQSPSAFKARPTSFVCKSFDDVENYVENKSVSVLCVSQDEELLPYCTAKSSSMEGQETSRIVPVASSNVFHQNVNDEHQPYVYTKSASVLCPSDAVEPEGSRQTEEKEITSIYLTTTDNTSHMDKATDMPSLFGEDNAAPLSYQRELCSSITLVGNQQNTGDVQFANKSHVFRFEHPGKFDGEDAGSCASCGNDITNIADSCTFSQTIKSSQLVRDLVCAVVQCDSGDLRSPHVNKTASASAQCESQYFSLSDTRSQSGDSTCYIDDDMPTKLKKTVSVQISFTEFSDSDDHSTVMNSTLSSIGDFQTESIRCQSSEINWLEVSKLPKHDAASNFETACVQPAPSEATSGDQIYVKSFSIQAGEDMVKDIGTECSFSTLRDIESPSDASQGLEDSLLNIQNINKDSFIEYGGVTTSDQPKLSESIFSDQKEMVGLIDHRRDDSLYWENGEHSDSTLLVDQLQKSLNSSKQGKGKVAFYDQPKASDPQRDGLSPFKNLERLSPPHDNLTSLILIDRSPKNVAFQDSGHECQVSSKSGQESLPSTDHHLKNLYSTISQQQDLVFIDSHQASLALSDRHQESLALSDRHQENLALSDRHQESLALSDRHQESLALSDRHQENLALNDLHQESLALSDRHHESLSLSDRHQESLALSDRNQKSLDLSDRHQESLALSDRHQESLALSDRHQESLALSDRHQESLALSDRHLESLALSDRRQESLALNDLHQESLALSDRHQESLALSDHHHESLSLSDRHQESLALSDRNQESLALSDRHQESLALSDRHQESLALSDRHQESLALSYRHQESLALSDRHHESFALSDRHQEMLAPSDNKHESLALTDRRPECLSFSDHNYESLSAMDSNEGLPQLAVSKKPHVPQKEMSYLPTLVVRRQEQETEPHVNNDLMPTITQMNSTLGVLVRLNPCRHVPEQFTAPLPLNDPTCAQENAHAPLQQKAPNEVGTLSSKLTKKKLPSLSLRSVNDKKVSLSDVPEEDILSIRTTPPRRKENTRLPDIKADKKKQSSVGRRKVPRDQELSSACDTLATKEDVGEYSKRRKSLHGKVTFSDYLHTSSVNVKRLASQHQLIDLANKDITGSMQPSEASTTMCNTLEDVDAIASSISIATPTRNSLCLLEDIASLAAVDAGEALKKSDREDVSREVDAGGDITNVCDVLDRLVQPKTRNLVSTLSELTVYTVGEDPELQVKLSEDNPETLGVLDLPSTEETSGIAHQPGDFGETQGGLAADVDKTDEIEDLPEQALRSPGVKTEEVEELPEQTLRTPLDQDHEEELPEPTLRTPLGQGHEGELSEQILRTPDGHVDDEGDLPGQNLKAPVLESDEGDVYEKTLRTPVPQLDEEGDPSERTMRTPGLEANDHDATAALPDSMSPRISVKKFKGDGTVADKNATETSEASFTTFASDTETKAGGDKPKKQTGRRVPAAPPGGQPDDEDKKKPTAPLKRKKIDRHVLFPPHVIAESHYYHRSNTINVVVKPINAQLPTDGLNVKVHVHRRQSRLPVIQSQDAVVKRKRSQPSPNYTLKRRVNTALPLITLDRDIIDLRAANPPFNTATNPEADTRYQKFTRNWRIR